MIDTTVTYIVVMDKPGAKEGRMPRSFYRRLGKVEAARIQKSVYLCHNCDAMKMLVSLGKAFGFMVQAFKVVEEDDQAEL